MFEVKGWKSKCGDQSPISDLIATYFPLAPWLARSPSPASFISCGKYDRFRFKASKNRYRVVAFTCG